MQPDQKKLPLKIRKKGKETINELTEYVGMIFLNQTIY